jgi:hypothetical protein
MHARSNCCVLQETNVKDRMKVLPPLSLLLWALSTEAMADKWVLVDSTPTARAEIETQYIVKHFEVRRVRMRVTYTADEIETRAGDQALFLTEYNCASRESRDLERIDRDHPATAIYEGPSTGPPFHAIAPLTFDEAAFKYVCQTFFDRAQPGEPGWIVGMGQQSCASFLAAVREHAPNGQRSVEQGNVSRSDLFQQWLWGYVSVDSSRNGLAVKGDGAGITQWVVQWCESHDPDEQLVSAAGAYVAHARRPDAYARTVPY